jgi:tRNA1Val (adenine37-N6)-methyltransferase
MFMEEPEDSYDLIVSNPPFYQEEMPSGDRSRDKARQASSLPFEELLKSVSKLLSPNGLFAVVIPYKEEAGFVRLADESGLFLKKATRVKGTPQTAIKRSLLAFSPQKVTVEADELVIEEKRHVYTQAYTELTRDFYLKMGL